MSRRSPNEATEYISRQRIGDNKEGAAAYDVSVWVRRTLRGELPDQVGKIMALDRERGRSGVLSDPQARKDKRAETGDRSAGKVEKQLKNPD